MSSRGLQSCSGSKINGICNSQAIQIVRTPFQKSTIPAMFLVEAMRNQIGCVWACTYRSLYVQQQATSVFHISLRWIYVAKIRQLQVWNDLRIGNIQARCEASCGTHLPHNWQKPFFDDVIYSYRSWRLLGLCLHRHVGRSASIYLSLRLAIEEWKCPIPPQPQKKKGKKKFFFVAGRLRINLTESESETSERPSESRVKDCVLCVLCVLRSMRSMRGGFISHSQGLCVLCEKSCNALMVLCVPQAMRPVRWYL